MSVTILKEGDILIASIQEALSDNDLTDLRDGLAESIGRHEDALAALRAAWVAAPLSWRRTKAARCC